MSINEYVGVNPDELPKYESSCSMYTIQDEYNEQLPIHNLNERPYFNFQVEMEEKQQFTITQQNKPLQRKEPIETVQEMVYTEERIECCNLSLKTIPQLSQNLINIKLLNLSQNQLTQVPIQLIKMINLKKLVLNKNLIKTLPPFLQTFKHLESLEIAENQITQFMINPPSLKHLNIACNFIEDLFFPLLDHLCIQMNAFKLIPQGFEILLIGMQQLELDWFKYCKPALPMKLNFEKYGHIREKLISRLQTESLNFKDFITLLSLAPPNLTITDYKDRNLYFQAGINDEIGILKSLHDIIPEQLNQLDFDQMTCMSACYQENRMRSVNVIEQLGGYFTKTTILQICQRADLENLIIMQDQYIANMDENIFKYKNVDGNGPLHFAMMNFQKNEERASRICDILLTNGADPNEQNNEGWTALDFAIRKSQLGALKYAAKYNEIHENKFDFHTTSGPWAWNLVHLATSVANLDILEFLLKYNADFFALSKCNRQPRQMAIQSLTMLKSMRKMEKLWILKNVIVDQNLTLNQEKNVYEMKNQIEKNMAKKQLNMVQKILDQEDEDEENLGVLDDDHARNIHGSEVASESSVKEAVVESAPIFLRMANQQINKMQLHKHNMEQLNQQDFIDHNPEILRLLRNQLLDSAFYKIKNTFLSDGLPLSERLKYKTILKLLSFKLKNFKKYELKSNLSYGIQVILNEYSFKPMTLDQRNYFLKTIAQINKEQNAHERAKIKKIIEKNKEFTSQQMIQKEMTQVDPLTITELRSRLSNTLVYDITNYADKFWIQNEQAFYWFNSMANIPCKFKINSNLCNAYNYEYLQKMQQYKKEQRNRRQDDKLELDMIEPEAAISTYRQFQQLNTPFQQKR